MTATNSTGPLSLTGGAVLTPEGGLERGDVHLAGGEIVETAGADATRVDCTGLHILPGIVDVHGDAFELELHPRPGVDMPFAIALGSVDRQLLTNGITTAFHGLTISWEPGARSLDAGRRFMEALKTLRSRLSADHRVQLRWETFAHHAIEDLTGWLAEEPRPALAFNDHTTSTMEKVKAGTHAKLEQWALRAGITPREYLDEVDKVSERAPDVPGKIAEMAALADKHGAIMLSHDERNLSERADNRARGMDVCEFPLAREVAEDARAHQEHVVLGGPNVLRGGSHTGAMGAEDAIAGGACSVLATDYYYPSLLHAAEHLVNRGVLPLADAWALISQNPASAMGLTDRGQVTAGHRADLVVLDTSGPWRIVHTIVGGRLCSM